MRVGYGYKRHERDFMRLDVGKVWLDMPGTGRHERGSMLRPGGLRAGDVIVVLDARDLGKRVTDAVDAMGITVEVCPPDGPLRAPGAPAKYNPDEVADAAVQVLWVNPGYSMSYVLRRASEMVGMDVKRHHLVHRYGNRHKR